MRASCRLMQQKGISEWGTNGVLLQGVMYADSVWADETSYDAPYKYDEARGGAEGGYAAVSSILHGCMLANGGTRLCWTAFQGALTAPT